MPAKMKCKETLQQVRERLIREQRLRTEKRLRELLEPEQLAVTEDESESSDSGSEESGSDKQLTLSAVPVQACLILTFCFVLTLLATWIKHNIICLYKICTT
jgi:hypothetical protein